MMQSPNWKGRVVNFWPTLLMRRTLPGHDEWNEKLRLTIESAEARNEQLTTHYQGVDFFNWDEPSVQWLKTSVDDSVHAYFSGLGMEVPTERALQGWVNVNRAGDYHTPHNHGWCYLSGTYYVAMAPPGDDSPRNGAISFYDPRVSANMLAIPGDSLSRHEYTLRPAPGTLLMWHAALQHLVHPHWSQEPRITVSFNVVLQWDNRFAE